MKFYNMTSQQNIFISTAASTPMQSQYDVPYERNDEYLKLINQEDPRNPESLLEPESGMLLYADIDFEYNYHVPKFQQFSQASMRAYINNSPGQDLHEQPKFLPSINVFLLSGSSLVENNNDFENLYDASYTLYNTHQPAPSHIPFGLVVTELPVSQFSTAQNQLSREYFEQVPASFKHLYEWKQLIGYNSMHEAIWDLKIDHLRDFYPGIKSPEFINIDMARIYADTENKREMFPFFAKFKLTGVSKNSFCDLLVSADLVDDFVDFLVMHREFKTEDVTYFSNTLGADGLWSHEEFMADVWGYDVNTFIAHLQNHGSGQASTFAANQTTCSTFESYLKSLMFGNILNSWISTAQKNSSMPVAFRLEKYFHDDHSSTNNLVSVHYFFNYSELLEFKYFDSMVAPEFHFHYKLNVINAMTPDNVNLYFTEEPFYSETILILDSPPVAPDVEILTYRGVGDKNLILINQMIDKEALVPVLINPSDYEQFERQYEAQKIDRPNPIIFESDSPSDFEIFRLTEKPTTYADFAKGMYKFIKTEHANSVAYEDQIVPNQYYYYIFRAHDPNGYPSNPTPVYEFVLLKDGETMYPKTRIIDFKQPDPPTQKSKSFKKYLKIGFSPRQYTFGDVEMALPNFGDEGTEVRPGVSEDNIIGSERVFKFRIRSKNTGKLIDINVTFKKNNVIQA